LVVAKFKLRAGKHVLGDKSKPINGPDGKPTGRYESKVITAGQTFESDRDLATAEPQRYEAVGGHQQASRIAELEAELARVKAQQGGAIRTPGDPTLEVAATSPAVAPGGQVSTGFQQASGLRSAAMLPDEAVKHGAQEGQGEGQGAEAQTEEEGPDDYESMTLTELRAKAEEDEIDLPSGYVRKEDLIHRLRAAKRK
jgi:hypothetical protein